MQPKRMPKRPAGACCGLSLVIALFCATAYSITLVPTDLFPGDTYHLAFVSHHALDANSSHIASYDAFVQVSATDAGGGLESISWKVIGSTATVSAITHIGALRRCTDCHSQP
ncbi:hypothetical protein HYR99_38835 [Candidatus Poribacteria bacterium]|nr:hypothetical protein [Candidatus Poribacteria bacterium]